MGLFYLNNHSFTGPSTGFLEKLNYFEHKSDLSKLPIYIHQFIINTLKLAQTLFWHLRTPNRMY